MISLRRTLALLAATALMAVAGCAQKTDKPAEASNPFGPENIRGTLGLPASAKVQYADEDGTVVTYAEFEQRMTKGQSIELIKDGKSDNLTVKLQSAKTVAKNAAEQDAKRKAHPINVPAIDLTDLAGRHYHDEDLRGRPTLLSFFFDTCAPCIKEVPVLNAFAGKHPEFNYLAITFDPADAAKKFVEQRKLAWPVVAGAGAFIESAGVRSFPTYLLVDADGRLVADSSGMSSRAMTDVAFGVQELEQWVAGKLANK